MRLATRRCAGRVLHHAPLCWTRLRSLTPRDPAPALQIFEKHGVVEEVFLMRGGSRSGMACAFIRFAAQEMAQEAIDAIHGNITLPDAAEPLVVRWADTPGSRGRETRRTGAGGRRGGASGGDRRSPAASGSYGTGMSGMMMQPNAYTYTPQYVQIQAPMQVQAWCARFGLMDSVGCCWLGRS